MRLRKLNAALSLLTTFLFLNHAIFLAVWMLSRCSIEKNANDMPFVLVGVMAIHAALSILLAVLSRKGKEKSQYKAYLKMNIPTFIQQISGILMLLLLGLHILGASNHFQPKMLHAILHPLFFASALAHISVSASKALITLGIGNTRVIRLVDLAMRVLCLATFGASVIGFYLCLFVGVAR